MKFVLIPGLYRCIWEDDPEPILSPRLSLAPNQTFFSGEILYVSGAKEDPAWGSRDPGNPHALWELQPIDAPNEKKYAPAFPDGFELVASGEVRRILETRPHLKPQMRQALAALLD